MVCLHPEEFVRCFHRANQLSEGLVLPILKENTFIIPCKYKIVSIVLVPNLWDPVPLLELQCSAKPQLSGWAARSGNPEELGTQQPLPSLEMPVEGWEARDGTPMGHFSPGGSTQGCQQSCAEQHRG